MKQLCIHYKPDNERAVQVAHVLRDIFSAKGWGIQNDFNAPSDVLICISGDGTLLSALRSLHQQRYKVLILGIHGSAGLGFLHTLPLPPPDQMQSWGVAVFEHLSKGQYSVEKRWGLSISRPRDSSPLWAMNDVVISRAELSRMISLEIALERNNKVEILYPKLKGDGLLIASATGSTAYNLAAGGPVMLPYLKNLCLTPLCPHDAAHRPVVLGGEDRIRVRILENKSPVFMTLDGQSGQELEIGDEIWVSQSSEATQWLCLEGGAPFCHPYMHNLREKRGFDGGF